MTTRIRLALLGLLGVLAGCDGATGPVLDERTHDLIFEGYLGSTPELLAWNDDLASVRRLLPEGFVVMDPTPSPDGTRIAFVVPTYDEFASNDIWVMNTDGSSPARVTTDSEVDDQPTWSPDGSRIAFRSYREQNSGDIWVMDADGTDLVNLTPDPLPGVTEERHPAWSPDGSRIAFVSNRGGNYDLWTMTPEGTDWRRITSTPDLDAEPSWSPDGRRIAFRRSVTGTGSDINVLTLATGVVTPFPVLQTAESMPVWTPDGSRIVFVSRPSLSGRADLWSMRPDGTDRRPIVADEVAGGSVQPAFLRRR